MKLLPVMLMIPAGVAAVLLIDGRPSTTAGSVSVASGGMIYRGIAIQVDTSYQPLQRYMPMVHEIADLGADTVLFSVNAYQTHAGSIDIQVDPARTPPDAVWRALFEAAHGRGLKIVLMPKILLSEPRGQEWRGVINPGRQWALWFERYREFMMHYARLAAAGEVAVFVVGSELLSAEKHTDRWRALIAEVRTVFRGQVTYSANWDHYTAVQFWDDLDLVAMTSYYRTADALHPSQVSLEAAWHDVRSAILAWQASVGKPILFTEVGWCSQEGCSQAPWNYHRNPVASAAGLREQRLNYQAFLETWQSVDAVAGIIWWEWAHHPAGSSDHGYAPKNKPAEAVLRSWFEQPFSGRPAD